MLCVFVLHFSFIAALVPYLHVIHIFFFCFFTFMLCPTLLHNSLHIFFLHIFSNDYLMYKDFKILMMGS